MAPTAAPTVAPMAVKAGTTGTTRRGWLAGAAAVSASALAGCGHAGLAVRREPPAPTAARLAAFDHVLLGEVHDNPRHHAERAEVLRALLADGRPTVVLFEMMGRGHDATLVSAVERLRRAGFATPALLSAAADEVAAAAGLDRRGWGWPLHRPIVEAALSGGAALRGANLEASEARAAVREGLAALPADVRAALSADTRWDDLRQREMLRLIDEGHCGVLPARLHAPMVLAQRARDVAMALAMQAAQRGDPGSQGADRRTVLIAGNGHVRRDLGVPHVLASLGVPADRMVAVGFLETGQSTQGFDLFAVTPPPAGRPDPCEGLRRRAPAS